MTYLSPFSCSKGLGGEWAIQAYTTHHTTTQQQEQLEVSGQRDRPPTNTKGPNESIKLEFQSLLLLLRLSHIFLLCRHGI